MKMENDRSWVYKNLEIQEGLKPGVPHFQYFFKVLESGQKKCNYCVWIEDESLSHFAPSKEFDEIATSQRKDWSEWVQGKIDQGDFRNVVLKLEKTGRKEIDLNEMEEKLTTS